MAGDQVSGVPGPVTSLSSNAFHSFHWPRVGVGAESRAGLSFVKPEPKCWIKIGAMIVNLVVLLILTSK